MTDDTRLPCPELAAFSVAEEMLEKHAASHQDYAAARDRLRVFREVSERLQRRAAMHADAQLVRKSGVLAGGCEQRGDGRGVRPGQPCYLGDSAGGGFGPRSDAVTTDNEVVAEPNLGRICELVDRRADREPFEEIAATLEVDRATAYRWTRLAAVRFAQSGGNESVHLSTPAPARDYQAESATKC